MAVDKEIRRIIDEQYSRARAIIEDNRDKIEKMAAALLEWETLDAEQISDIMAGREPRPPENIPPSKGSGDSAGKPKAAAKPRVKPTPAGEH